ncbi:MAG: M48 family metallopeptidase [Desulfofustis sp.]|jgi:predicted Zn-dependent protease|nr:M48 family metallopeptidase [Desulfofustis sp.]
MRRLCALILLVFLTGCATSPTGRHQLMLMSPEQAIVASSKAYAQTMQPLVKEGKVDSNPATAARVREITGRIIAQAIELYPYTKSWDWSIKVIDDPETVNAWCMAGGKMAIYTGLIDKVKPTDDELAQVLAHEISHALANHTAERMSMAMATQLGILGVGIASRNSDNRGAILTGSALAAMLAIQLPNSRSAETEADAMGLELAARAGYNPNAAATLWEKMEKVGSSSPAEFLSTHPSPGNRQATLRALAPRYMGLYQDPRVRPVYQFKN